MRFAFIAKHRGIWPVSWICGALGVSRSGFHAWLGRAPSARARSDIEIGGKVLDRQFAADRPNQKWVADFTYIWTAENWLYLAAVIDLFSRRVVG